MIIDQIQTKKIIKQLLMYNKDYTLKEVSSMVQTSIWELEDPTPSNVYFSTLRRILEEKGIKYINHKFFNPFENGIQIHGSVHNRFISPDFLSSINYFFTAAKLSQKEMMVLTLTYSIEPPQILDQENKKIIDNIGEEYYFRKLSESQIANLLHCTVSSIAKTKRAAFNKLHEVVYEHK